MNQNAVIPCIISLNRLISLTIDNYFMNYEILKKSAHFYEYEQLQIKIHMLKEKLINGFSWYCGSTLDNEEKKMNGDWLQPENKDPFRQQYNLLTLALEQNQTICSGLVANYDYKQLFIEIKDTCEAQLQLTKNILQKAKRKSEESHFYPKYIKRRETTKTYAS